MTVVTTNIRFDNPEDGENSWPHRRKRYCRLMEHIGADVIATQEGWHDQLRDIDRCLAEHTLVDAHRDWLEDRMYPCLFVRSQAFSVGEAGDVWLSETPDIAGSMSFASNFPRLMTWARLKHRVGGTRYLVANVHLDNSTEDTRQKQLVVGLDRLAKVARPEEHIVLLGDFNSPPTGPVYDLACSLGNTKATAVDPWTALHRAERGTYHAFLGPGHEYDRIDWILLDARLQCAEIACSFYQESGSFPSDHFPVVCRGIRPRTEPADPVHAKRG